MPYFGRWPPWLELYLETCRWNPGIHWQFFSDCGKPPDLPLNVTVEPITLPELLQEAERALGISIKWRSSYKLCDLRPAFGDIFRSAVEGFDYFGWGDLDVVYGALESFIAGLLQDHDCIAFNRKHLSGHLCLFRNDDRVRGWYRRLPDWQTRMESEEYTHLDEISPVLLRNFLEVYARESYNTPLSPLIRWTDGTFNFPSEWYWKDGVLTNNKDGDRQFPYLHFMHWKGGSWPRQCGNAQWERLDQLVHLRRGECKRGFRVNERGFFPLFAETSKATAGARSEARPMKVSIIIPVYNAASTLSETLASVRRQSYSHWEAVIVDDGSTDDSLSIARAAAETDARFRVVSQGNRGASAARNTGIAQATFDWLLFLDADDWIAPNHLEVMTAALSSRPDLDAVVCKWVLVYKDEQQGSARRCRDLDQLFAQTVAGCPFAIHACMMRKGVVDSVGGFNEELRTCGDWHFWQKIARTGAKFGSVDEVLAFYRKQSPDSLSSDPEQLLQDALTVFRMGLTHTDPAVKRQLIDRTDKKFLEALAAAKYNALLYWGTARICRGKSAAPYWAHIEPGLELKTSVPAIAKRLLSLMMKLHLSEEMGPEIWPQVRASVLEFLERLESLSGVPRLAARVTRDMALSLLDRPGGNPCLVEGLYGVSVEALADIPDVTMPADAVEGIVVAVTVAGRPVGSVYLRPSGIRVAAKVIKDAIADRFVLEIIHRIMAQPAEPQPKPRPRTVNAATFCEALLAKAEAGREDTRDSPIEAYDGTTPVPVELTENLPDILAGAGEKIAVAASLGGAALGTYRIPAPGGQVSGQKLSKAIRRLAGINLARVCLREAVVGHPPATIEEIKQRLRRQAELSAREYLRPHQAVQHVPLSTNRVADSLLVRPGSPPFLSAGLASRRGEPIQSVDNHPGWVTSLPILAYHRIAPPEQSSLGRYCVSPDEFAWQLAFLHDAGFYTIGWQSLQLHLYYGLPLPGRPIVITFDDGYKDFAEAAFPALRKHGFTATVFVSPAHVGGVNVWDGGTVPLLSWSDIGELADNHVGFGSRGLTHQPLTGISAVEAGAQLARSRQILEERLGSQITVVAYPYGDVDPLVEHLASAAGYAMGLTISARQCRLSDRLMALPRIELHGGMTFDQFVQAVVHRPYNSVAAVKKVCGLLEDINRPDLALATARDWAEPCSGDSAFHFHLARLMDRQELQAEAIEAYQKAVELEPSRADYSIHLATALEELGLRDEAIEVVARVAALPLEHASLHECLGVLLRRAGRHAEAEIALSRAITLNPDSTRAHLHLIAALKGQGRVDEALRLAERCALKFPAHAAFSQQLSELRARNSVGA
jgi:peptidoglycan/xylan/chitin deacetylase (PgdA/CDA1 family)